MKYKIILISKVLDVSFQFINYEDINWCFGICNDHIWKNVKISEKASMKRIDPGLPCGSFLAITSQLDT